VTDGGKTLAIHLVGDYLQNLDGKDANREITSLTNDELRINNSIPQTGGHADAVWKRAK
jgi:hypothetical protein